MAKIILYHGTPDETAVPAYGLGIQYCIKSEKAYSQLTEIIEELSAVDYEEFNTKYNERDSKARQNMRDLVDSDANKVTKVFSTLFGR